MSRPLSPSQRQAESFREAEGQVDDSWTKFRPGTSPAACTSPGSESLRTARPWTVSLASVKSFTSGSLAADSWSELLSKGIGCQGLDGWELPGVPSTKFQGLDPVNPKTEILSKSLVTKATASCAEYRLRKREHDLRAFYGIWSNMSFRRPRGMDILADRARAARKPPVVIPDGFVERGPTGQTAHEIAKQTPVLETLNKEYFVLIDRLIEADAMHFVSVTGGQVLFKEKDKVENAYIVLSGSVQQYSADNGFLRSMGWHPHEEEGDGPSPGGHSSHGEEDQEPEDPRSLPTMMEFCRMGGRPDDEPDRRYRTLEGHSVFSQDSFYGNLWNTATAGCVVGEPALKGEKLWRSTALCLKDTEFLVIDGTIFLNVLKSVRETHRFFELYLPGIRIIPSKAKMRPYPTEYWKREFLPIGETILEEGMEPLEPLVFMVQYGTLELRRYRRPCSNPAYVLAKQPLRGRPVRMCSQELPSALPEIARSFVEDLDEDGLPRLGLPPPLKGSVRQKMEGAYFADPKSFIPADVPTSVEGAKVYRHKVLLKERLESRAEEREERLRDKVKLERRLAEKAEEELRNDLSPRKSPESMDEIRALMRYVQAIQAARPGSPDYIGEDLWSDRPSREWMSRDVSTGPFSRPPSSHVITEPDTREDLHETCAVLKPGDLYCSLSFLPLWGVSEPFSVVVTSPNCCVHFVRGVQEAKTIPKHILKEIRLEIGKSLQKKLGNLIKSTSKEGDTPAAPFRQNEVNAPESEAPAFPGSPATAAPGDSPRDASPDASPVVKSRSIKRDDRLQASEPLLRPRSAESLRSDDRSDDLLGGFSSSLPPRKVRQKPYRPSFFRWLIYGKTPPKERGGSSWRWRKR